MLEQKDLEMIAEVVEEIVDRKLQPVKEDVQQVKSDVEQAKNDIQQVKSDVEQAKNDVQQVKSDVEQAKNDIQQVKNDVEQVKMTLENETNRNIQIIAEGHSDLTRKLNEALKLKEDDEIIRTRLNRLESELEILKKKIG